MPRFVALALALSIVARSSAARVDASIDSSALRDAGAHFITTFGSTPDVATWLNDIASRAAAEDVTEVDHLCCIFCSTIMNSSKILFFFACSRILKISE